MPDEFLDAERGREEEKVGRRERTRETEYKIKNTLYKIIGQLKTSACEITIRMKMNEQIGAMCIELPPCSSTPPTENWGIP